MVKAELINGAIFNSNHKLLDYSRQTQQNVPFHGQLLLRLGKMHHSIKFFDLMGLY